jgi:hypothetical protein
MRRRLLWIFGVLSLALLVILALLDQRMQDSGGPGIIGFELAGSREEAAQILSDWGERGQRAARASLWIDFAYLVFYSAFLCLAALATRDFFARTGHRTLASLGLAAAVAAVAGGFFDAVEDVNLLVVLDHDGGDDSARAAAICAGCKFVLISLAVLYVLAGLGVRLKRRLARPSAS